MKVHTNPRTFSVSMTDQEARVHVEMLAEIIQTSWEQSDADAAASDEFSHACEQYDMLAAAMGMPTRSRDILEVARRRESIDA